METIDSRRVSRSLSRDSRAAAADSVRRILSCALEQRAIISAGLPFLDREFDLLDALILLIWRQRFDRMNDSPRKKICSLS